MAEGCPFKKGDKVEIAIDEEGFRGAWFSATVVKPPAKRGKNKKVTIDYDTLVSEDDETTPLRDTVDIVKIRPFPPHEANRTFEVSDEVDAYHNDGWWEGIVMEVVLAGSKYAVYFRPSGEQIEFDVKDLRLHREWRNQDWVPPLQQQVQKASTSGLNRENEIQGEMHNKGNPVEVSSDEDGYKGAWFAASVVEVLGKGKYLIEYQELRTDDDTDFVKEEVDALHIRPTPPKIDTIDRFSRYEEVDALHNDGWWVGVISKVHADSTYLVYFKESNEEIKFRHDELRPHQDWMDGKWVTTSKVINSGD